MIIDWQELEPETLDNVIKESILSQLEDYQMENVTMQNWIETVKTKLRKGEAVIEWSEANETVAIVDSKRYR